MDTKASPDKSKYFSSYINHHRALLNFLSHSVTNHTDIYMYMSEHVLLKNYPPENGLGRHHQLIVPT